MLRNQLNDPTTTFGQLSFADKQMIAEAIEQEIKWLDSNPKAKIDDFRAHQEQLQQVAIRTTTNDRNSQSDREEL
jgi:hypothetical protein